MGILGGIGKQALNIAGRNFLGVDFEAQKRKLAEIERMKMLSAKAASLFNPIPGQTREIPGQMRQMDVMGDGGDSIEAAFGPQMERGPSRMEQGPSRPPTSQELMLGLANIQGQGGDVEEYRKLAEFGKRKLSNFEGQITDDSTGEILASP